MGIPVDRQELDVERRWTRIAVDKQSGTATLTEETGAWVDGDTRWVTLSSQFHQISPVVLAMLSDLPLSSLGLGRDAKLGDVLNTVIYGILTGKTAVTLKVQPTLKDAVTGETLEGGEVLFLNAPNAPGGWLPLDKVPNVVPAEGMRVMIQAPGVMPVTLDVPLGVGVWEPEVTLPRAPSLPLTPPPVPQSEPAASPAPPEPAAPQETPPAADATDDPLG